jgi:hypothetical protein
MRLSDEGLLVILVVGVIAGWLAGKIVKGQTGSCIALDFISALESLASSSTPQSERSSCSWLCGFWARADERRNPAQMARPQRSVIVPIYTIGLGRRCALRHRRAHRLQKRYRRRIGTPVSAYGLADEERTSVRGGENSLL